LFSIKIIKKEVVEKESIVEQLVREIKIQSFLVSPHVVKLYDVFDDAENVYLLLELCCAGNLYQYMRKKGKLSEN
jgi:serine/threonine protein kinase